MTSEPKHWLDVVVNILSADTGDLRVLAKIAGGDPSTFYVGTDLSKLGSTGPNFRKLMYASGLTAGAYAAAFLNVGAISPAAESAVIAASFSEFLAGINGNFAHQFLDDTHLMLFDGVASRSSSIDGNHHILVQFRRSNLNALTQLAADLEAEAADLADRTFSETLIQFLHQAEVPARLSPQAEVSDQEKTLFGQLSDASHIDLTARNSDTAAKTLNEVIHARDELLRLAFDELAAEIGGYCSPTFLTLACRDEGGFVDLFVRDAANALRENIAFRSIWVAEKQRHIQDHIRNLRHQVEKRLDGVYASLSDEEERILAAVSQAKGVPFERLRPILKKLSNTNVREAQYAEILSDTVDQLLAQSREKVLSGDRGAEVDLIIETARKKLVDLDIDGARSTLAAAVAERRKGRNEGRKAEAALLLEKAWIEEVAFDYATASSDLEAAASLDADLLDALSHLGLIRLKVGNLSGAIAAFEQMLSRAEALGDTRSQMVASGELGIAFDKNGQSTRALEMFRKSLAFAERLVAENNTPESQRDLTVCLEKIGDAFLKRGDPSTALFYYERGYSIRKDLAKVIIRNAQAQRDLAMSLERIADILKQRGDLSEALDYYQRSLEIFMSLANRGREAQRDVAICQTRIGSILEKQGELDGALERFNFGFQVFEQIYKADPSLQAMDDFLLSLREMGSIFFQKGDWPTAQFYYRRAVEICETAGSYNDTPNGQRNFALALERLGDLLLHQRDFDGAMRRHEQGLTLRRSLARDEQDAQAQRYLSVGLNKVGDILRQQHRFTDALAYYQEGLAIAEMLTERDDGAEAQRYLSVCLNLMGDLLRFQDNLKDAQPYYERSLKIRLALAESSGSAEAQFDLATVYWRLTQVTNSVEFCRKGLDHLLALREQGQLAPVYENFIPTFEARLRELTTAPNEPT